jgi:hypothetical protein
VKLVQRKKKKRPQPDWKNWNSLGEKYKWLAEVVSQEQEREGGYSLKGTTG